jgi:DNA mismatch endonuclease (patch repair protein)
MGSVRQKNTGPEVRVRRVLHRLGYRFRLHRKDLPGTPDIVLPRHNLVIFVHGCFWHRHVQCPKASNPKTRASYWAEKFRQNVERDRRNEENLRAAGWRVATVWECELKDEERLAAALRQMVERPTGA